MTVHIGAKPGDIAPVVLLPGDPYRARWAAQTFLDDARLVNEVRGMLGYTGTWRGHPVTIHGTGMGMPSLSIYANELIRDYGAQTLIRIGSAGGMQPQVKVRDVVLAMSACTLSTPSRGIFRDLNFAPTADFGLMRAAWAAGQARGTALHAGPSIRPTSSMTNAPTCRNRCSATACCAWKWKRPSFTPLPPATAAALWRC
jgi:purine-nucleoside phosphorylase